MRFNDQGYDAFSVDITNFLKMNGETEYLEVQVKDPTNEMVNDTSFTHLNIFLFDSPFLLENSTLDLLTDPMLSYSTLQQLVSGNQCGWSLSLMITSLHWC